jgi:zinc transport system substrate-binding protein
MKKISALICAMAMLVSLSACGSAASASGGSSSSGDMVVAATTYPVYLFTTAVVGDVGGISVKQVITDKVSCIHDYTLTVPQMKILESADVVVENGAGFENFMSDALASSKAAVVDCSEGISLLKMTEDGQEEDDPHIWMSPANAELMLKNIAAGLSAADKANAAAYTANCDEAVKQIQNGIVPDGNHLSSPQTCKLITFHDGFQYFAQYFGLDLAASIEEESGSEASAKDIDRIVSLIKDAASTDSPIPAVFTEVNGSAVTAQAIARETGVKVLSLDLIMSGNGTGIQPYIDAVNSNYSTVRGAFAQKSN